MKPDYTDYTDKLPEEDRQIVLAAREIAARYVSTGPYLSSWSAAVDYLTLSYMGAKVETFRVLHLDRKNSLIRDVEMSVGTIDHVTAYPREIVRQALELDATAIILVHNHPSGETWPSDADIALTRKIGDACATLGIILHDHVIVGGGSVTSLRAMGKM